MDCSNERKQKGKSREGRCHGSFSSAGAEEVRARTSEAAARAAVITRQQQQWRGRRGGIQKTKWKLQKERSVVGCGPIDFQHPYLGAFEPSRDEWVDNSSAAPPFKYCRAINMGHPDAAVPSRGAREQSAGECTGHGERRQDDGAETKGAAESCCLHNAVACSTASSSSATGSTSAIVSRPGRPRRESGRGHARARGALHAPEWRRSSRRAPGGIA